MQFWLCITKINTYDLKQFNEVKIEQHFLILKYIQQRNNKEVKNILENHIMSSFYNTN